MRYNKDTIISNLLYYISGYPGCCSAEILYALSANVRKPQDVFASTDRMEKALQVVKAPPAPVHTLMPRILACPLRVEDAFIALSALLSSKGGMSFTTMADRTEYDPQPFPCCLDYGRWLEEQHKQKVPWLEHLTVNEPHKGNHGRPVQEWSFAITRYFKPAGTALVDEAKSRFLSWAKENGVELSKTSDENSLLVDQFTYF